MNCTAKLSFGECGKPAVIYLRDLKAKNKQMNKVYLCDQHFNGFCKSLVENKIEYEQS
jgi:hypothetical protein